MKNNFAILLVAVLFCCTLFCKAQTTVTFKLSSANNEALIWSHPSYVNTADPDDPSFEAGAWTWSGIFGIERSLMDFNITSIPANATVQSARLYLYNNPTSGLNGGQHSSLSGSNAAVLKRITTSWNEATATWNNQPATTITNQVSLAQSVTAHQDYLNVDVTGVVNDMVQNPASSFGFMIQLQTEMNYRCMIFASGANTDTTKRPVLVVTYDTVSVHSTCIIIKLDTTIALGQNSLIWSNLTGSNTPYPDYPSFEAGAWTWNGVFGIERSLMEYNLNAIPANATIVSASLDLYNDPTSSFNGGQHSSLTGSNASVIKKISDPWNENTATWNNQPNTTTLNQVFLSQSTSAHQDYLNINVTAMVTDMFQNPATSHGFMLEVDTEVQYRCLIFAGGGNADTTKRPVLHICYSIPNHPTTSFQSSGNTFCSEAGICVDFFDHSTGNPTSWQWSFPGAATTSSTLQNPTGICYTIPGTYAVTLITTNANGSDTLTISPMITLGQPPAPPTITLTGSDTLHSSPAPSYQWYYNGSPVFGATSSSYVATSAGTYAVRITDALGCSAISNGFTYVSVNELSQQNGFEIYPNPTSGEFTIYGLTPGPSPKARGERGIIEIYDVVGEKVFSEVFPSLLWRGAWGEATINFKLPPGVYFVKVSCPDNFGKNKETEWMKKIVVE